MLQVSPPPVPPPPHWKIASTITTTATITATAARSLTFGESWPTGCLSPFTQCTASETVYCQTDKTIKQWRSPATLLGVMFNRLLTLIANQPITRQRQLNALRCAICVKGDLLKFKVSIRTVKCHGCWDQNWWSTGDSYSQPSNWQQNCTYVHN